MATPADLVASGFRALARLRGARALHPRGLPASGRLTTEPDELLPIQAGTRPVTVRFSKGVGTPADLPDVLGLAMRVPAGSGDPGLWDIMLSSSGSGALSRMIPIPAAWWDRARFGSIAPYTCQGRRIWLSAVLDRDTPAHPASLDRLRRWIADRPVHLTIYLGQSTTDWRPVGRLTVDTVGDDPQDVAFDPLGNLAPGLTMSPSWLTWLREHAYRGSRAGRRAAEPVRASSAPASTSSAPSTRNPMS